MAHGFRAFCQNFLHGVLAILSHFIWSFRHSSFVFLTLEYFVRLGKTPAQQNKTQTPNCLRRVLRKYTCRKFSRRRSFRLAFFILVTYVHIVAHPSGSRSYSVHLFHLPLLDFLALPSNLWLHLLVYFQRVPCVKAVRISDMKLGRSSWNASAQFEQLRKKRSLMMKQGK